MRVCTRFIFLELILITPVECRDLAVLMNPYFFPTLRLLHFCVRFYVDYVQDPYLESVMNLLLLQSTILLKDGSL